jgi:transposase-like protein
MEEVFIKMNDVQHYLWRPVDQNGVTMALLQCMVRRLTAREKLRDEKVCVNVSGLLVENISWP